METKSSKMVCRAVYRSGGGLLKVALQKELGTVAAVFSEETKAGNWAECFNMKTR
jgi:hypothetical protein